VNPLNIRKATLDDTAAIARLSGELGYPVQAGTMRERLERILERDEHVVFVAETTEVAGWIHAAEHELLEIGRHCEICGLVVGSSQRGNGIGRRLIEAVEEWAPSRGLKQISVRSNVIRPESHPFYESLGFERYKTQHAYRKRLALPDS
jgi:ribosomal protein S18 acetylase RimI-like enzyme